MYRLRTLRRQMSGEGDSEEKAVPDRREEMHFLYAVCIHLSASQQRFETGSGFCPDPEDEKGMFRAEGAGVVHVSILI